MRDSLSSAFLLLALLSTGGCGSKAPYEGKSAAQLERMLHDASAAVQAQGAYGLSLLGPDARSAVPTLIEASTTKDTIVRQNSVLALGSIGPDARDAVPVLIQLLHDPEWTVRRQAALALGQIGPDAQAAVAELEKLSRDRDRLVRTAATQALGLIDPKRAHK